MNYFITAFLITLTVCACDSTLGESPSNELQVGGAIKVLFYNEHQCSDHTSKPNQVLMCPKNTYVIAISDRVADTKQIQFETVKCCPLRNSFGWQAEPVADSYKVESTQFGKAKECSGQGLLKGIGFDSSGAAGTMHCNSASVQGTPVVKTGWGTQQVLHFKGEAKCPVGMVGTGLSDNVKADGKIDNLRCQPVATY